MKCDFTPIEGILTHFWLTDAHQLGLVSFVALRLPRVEELKEHVAKRFDLVDRPSLLSLRFLVDLFFEVSTFDAGVTGDSFSEARLVLSVVAVAEAFVLAVELVVRVVVAMRATTLHFTRKSA